MSTLISSPQSKVHFRPSQLWYYGKPHSRFSEKPLPWQCVENFKLYDTFLNIFHILTMFLTYSFPSNSILTRYHHYSKSQFSRTIISSLTQASAQFIWVLEKILQHCNTTALNALVLLGNSENLRFDHDRTPLFLVSFLIDNYNLPMDLEFVISPSTLLYKRKRCHFS